jgi:hypothetical protein
MPGAECFLCSAGWLRPAQRRVGFVWRAISGGWPAIFGYRTAISARVFNQLASVVAAVPGRVCEWQGNIAGFIAEQRQSAGRLPDRSEGDRSRRVRIDGAGEGNRTLVVSLGSCCSTIELHPRYTAWTRTRPVSCSTAKHPACCRAPRRTLPQPRYGQGLLGRHGRACRTRHSGRSAAGW